MGLCYLPHQLEMPQFLGTHSVGGAKTLRNIEVVLDRHRERGPNPTSTSHCVLIVERVQFRSVAQHIKYTEHHKSYIHIIRGVCRNCFNSKGDILFFCTCFVLLTIPLYPLLGSEGTCYG
jgi:hypothetical protein